MSTSFQNIKNLFNEYICIYIGLSPPNKNIDENSLLPRINGLAYENIAHYIELSKIIVDHLNKDEIRYKIRLFHIIDSLFKNVGKSYIDFISQHLFTSFKECFTFSDLEDRILLFRIYYTWKYIVPSEITEKIRIDLKMDDFKEMAMKDYGREIKACDEFNEMQRKKILNSKTNNLNNKKELKEDKNSHGHINDKSILVNKINITDKIKKQKPEILIGKKRKTLQHKTTDKNTITKKKKKSENKNNNNSNKIPPQVNITNKNNIPQNNNSEQIAQLMNFLRNNPLNLMNFPILPNPQYKEVSKNEINIFRFIYESNIKLDENLRFFSSLAKYFNESVNKNKYFIEINCSYEDIKNADFQKIHQNQNNLLFNNIKVNLCTICGFRTLYYNKLTEHLDIHFNINYLQKEGKNLFRKKGNNRNNWITGDAYNNKKIKDNRMSGIGYTLSNLLYYKNMMNNNLLKINDEGQEEDNEELMYPIDDNNIRCCEFCGDEFKKVFSNKYNYWFYSEIIKIKDEKIRLLVHKTCYDEMMKKN